MEKLAQKISTQFKNIDVRQQSLPNINEILLEVFYNPFTGIVYLKTSELIPQFPEIDSEIDQELIFKELSDMITQDDYYLYKLSKS